MRRPAWQRLFQKQQNLRSKRALRRWCLQNLSRSSPDVAMTQTVEKGSAGNSWTPFSNRADYPFAFSRLANLQKTHVSSQAVRTMMTGSKDVHIQQAVIALKTNKSVAHLSFVPMEFAKSGQAPPGNAMRIPIVRLNSVKRIASAVRIAFENRGRV